LHEAVKKSVSEFSDLTGSIDFFGNKKGSRKGRRERKDRMHRIFRQTALYFILRILNTPVSFQQRFGIKRRGRNPRPAVTGVFMHVEIKVTEGPAKGQTFTFREPDCFLFGRAADARISLPDDPYISRHHFLLEISPPDCRVTELNSKNGMFVNGVRYGGRKPPEPGVIQAPAGDREARLKDGDEIAVGDTVMKVRIHIKDRFKETKTKIRQPYYIAEESEILPDADQPPKESPIDFLWSLLKDKEKSKEMPEEIPLIEGYDIKEEIGRGGMSIVFRAVDRSTGKTAAVKIMRPSIAMNAESIRLFQREIKITSRLKHKNIVEVLDYGKTETIFFFVLEFVEGTDLERYLNSQGGYLELEESLGIMLQLLDGLAYSHRIKLKMKFASGREKRITGIVHRDLKPENILLTRNGNILVPKLADFGLSKSFESAGFSNMTLAGQVAGTPVYWPREQITHYRYLSPVTDVFSIAAVFYQMLTGAYVREGFREMYDECERRNRTPGVPDYMAVISENPPIPIRERRSDIPKAVAAVIDRAIQEVEVPSDEAKMRSVLAGLRYADAGVFREELLAACKKAGVMIQLPQE
jgi:serine/threonine protein kinase